jgi:hypothetical protein
LVTFVEAKCTLRKGNQERFAMHASEALRPYWPRILAEAHDNIHRSAVPLDWEAAYWLLKAQTDTRIKQLERQLAAERARAARTLAETIAEMRGERLVWPDEAAAERGAAAVAGRMADRAAERTHRIANARQDDRRAIMAEARRNVREPERTRRGF